MVYGNSKQARIPIMDNVVKDTEDNIKAVCRVLCERDYITADEKVYYAQIAGFNREKDKSGNEFYRFAEKYSKADYLHALADILFVEKPKDYTRSDVLKALDFFLNNLAETRYSVWRYWNGLEQSPILKAISQTELPQDGEKGTSSD